MNPIRKLTPLAFSWPGLDPFIFCVHHYDRYPAANDPADASLLGPPRKHMRGRDIGSDFSGKDGFSYYHGTRGVPGFPRHPHYGFETITHVRQGFVDHSDSTGASARFGDMDAQWITTGSGVQHSEMFTCVNKDKPNTVELFQIWINLPAKSKRAPPHFSMSWGHAQPWRVFKDESGAAPDAWTKVHVVGGSLAGLTGPAPPPNSWAADPNNHVVVAEVTMSPKATWTLPRVPQAPGDDGVVNRMLYFFRGSKLRVAGAKEVPVSTGIHLAHDADVKLENVGPDELEILILQGRPINEPVVQQGPFVTNSQDELRNVFAAFRRTEFGGWPFDTDEPTHPRDAKRFAKFGDGTSQTPEQVEAFKGGDGESPAAQTAKQEL